MSESITILAVHTEYGSIFIVVVSSLYLLNDIYSFGLIVIFSVMKGLPTMMQTFNGILSLNVRAKRYKVFEPSQSLKVFPDNYVHRFCSFPVSRNVPYLLFLLFGIIIGPVIYQPSFSIG